PEDGHHPGQVGGAAAQRQRVSVAGQCAEAATPSLRQSAALDVEAEGQATGGQAGHQPAGFEPRPTADIHGPPRARRAPLRSQRLRAALKDGAQFVGLMLAGLEVSAAPAGEQTILEARFTSDSPALAAELCAYVVAGMAAEAAGDTEWDRETPLLELQERRA